MNEIFHEGEWFLNEAGAKTPGRLRFAEEGKNITLQTFGNCFLDGTQVKDEDKKTPVFYHELIMGDARGEITLHQCRWSGTEHLGSDLYQIDYEVGYVFFGVLIADESKLLVSAGEFMFPQLASFIDNDPLHGTIHFFEKDYQSKERQAVIEIAENLKIQFLDKKNERGRQPFEEKYYRTLRFIYDKPVAVQTLLQDAIHFKKLLEFSFGKPYPCQLLNVVLPDDKFVLIGNLSLLKGEKKISQHLRPSYHMLICEDNFEPGGMIKAIQLWYKYRSVSTIFDLYLDSNYWLEKSEEKLSVVMYNNRFLNIVQALENFYRVTRNELPPVVSDFNEKKAAVLKLFGDNNKELKKWANDNLNAPGEPTLRQKLDTILKMLQPEIDAWFTNKSTINHFTWYAAAMRNALSHGYHRQTKQGNELRLFFITGQVILAACILKALKVKDIKAAVLHYIRFKDLLCEINRSIIKVDK